MGTSLPIDIFFQVGGGLGLFLLGMKYMSEGMQAAAGNRLRTMISAVTGNRFTACAIGFLVTCLIQSSSVTTVMLVGFANAGLITLAQAVGVILGADIGTTITGWILVLDIGKYGLPMLGFSALFFLFCKSDKTRSIALLVMGLGMVFFGLLLMKEGFEPLRDLPDFLAWFSKFTPDTWWGIVKCTLAGAGITAVIQSSSATVGITMGLAASGIINFETSVALVLGQNIGTTITAWLASIGASRNAKRVAYAHIIIKVIGVIFILSLFPLYMKLVRVMLPVDPDLSVMTNGHLEYPAMFKGIAVAHTTFNVLLVILFLPFTRMLADLLTRIMPDSAAEEVPHLTYLDVRMLDTPSLGLEQSHRELLYMAESVKQMMGQLRSSLFTQKADVETHRKIFHSEEVLDNVQKEITEFLGGILSGNVTHNVVNEARWQVRMADEYESISDYIAGILKMLIKLRNHKLLPATEGQAELFEMHDRTAEYLDFINAALASRSNVLVEAVTRSDELTALMKEFRARHLERLTEGKVSPLVCLILPDMLSAYRRIKDHALNIAEVLAGEK
ncbi:MAG: Na/Pi cotransporter family protein [Pontiellaceae bacterium]|jgi:phosphate:Na+ symporter|nr:Na/Pi cotransporter family protein [Pontiellaceae bacterium]